MNLINNKKVVYITLIVIGVCIIITGILLKSFKGEELKSLSNVCICLGAILYIIFYGNLSNYIAQRKHPEIYRKKNIEVNDERNIIIRDKAWAKANSILVWLICAVILVFMLLDVELYILLVMVALLIINSGLFWIYTNYYKKRL